MSEKFTPPPMTDGEIAKMWRAACEPERSTALLVIDFVRSVEAARDEQWRQMLAALPIAGYAASLPGRIPDNSLHLDRERALQQAAQHHGEVFELIVRPKP